MRAIAILLTVIFFRAAGYGQTYLLSGRITEKGEALPFATIMVKGNSFATTSNLNGYYTLRLPPGKYEIIFQYIGYKKIQRTIDLRDNQKLDIALEPDGIALQEVEIKAGEDPAYAIIRKSIRMRTFYLDQVKSYSCRAYIKGLQRIDRLPRNIGKLAKIDGHNLKDTLDIKGVVYLSEAETRYYYSKPEEKEIMFSSRVSGNNSAFSFNQLSDLKLNFYENLVALTGLSTRPFVSPINENAFFFYRYFLLGELNSDGNKIYKIKVVPKRKNDPCFHGVIYVQDSSWRLTEIDVRITKENKISFVDTLNIKQSVAPVSGDSIWMPSNIHMDFTFGILGFHGSGYFNANISDYRIHEKFEKRFFKNEILKIENDANKKDSSYWSTRRSVPLTEEELNDYRQKDSIARIRDTDQYKDSTDKQDNKLKFRDVLLGYTYTNSRKKFYIKLPGILTDGVQYNTVEGLNLSYSASFEKNFEDKRRYLVSALARYGFSNKLWGGSLSYQRSFHPKTLSAFGFRVKSIVEQFNRQKPIPEIVNTWYTLLDNENYMKLFKESGVSGSFVTEIINGVHFTAVAHYMQRDPLKNTSSFLFLDDAGKYFTPNYPYNPEDNSFSFASHRALILDLTFKLSFSQKYYSLPDQKINAGSRYPRLTLNYRKALPVLGTQANFDLVQVKLSDDIRLGLAGNFSYRLTAGGFLNTASVEFMDYRHFNGNQTVINTKDYLESFRLLPYYEYSTTGAFAEAHAEHHFNGMLTNFIPVLKKLDLQEVAGFHGLILNNNRYFYEVSFGFERIFKILRFDYTLAYSSDKKFRSGFTLGLNFFF